MLVEIHVLFNYVCECMSFVSRCSASSARWTSRVGSSSNLVRAAELVCSTSRPSLHDGSEHALFHVLDKYIGMTAAGRSFTWADKHLGACTLGWVYLM